MSDNNIKYLWLFVLISYICFANARQIRYSRYTIEVTESRSAEDNVGNVADNQTRNNDETEIQATVREIKLAPYPASGFRPSKAFPLPNENDSGSADNEESVNESVTDELTTSTPESSALTTTIQGYDSETTTTSIIAVGEDILTENDTPNAPYPAAGFQPRIPFILPTDNIVNNQQQPQEEDVNLTGLSTTEIPEETTTVSPSDLEIKINFQPRIPLIAAGRNLLNLLKNQQQPQEENENVTELSITEISEETTTGLPLETEAKAPYPAAGYRPSKAFLLPAAQLKLEETKDSNPKEDNSKHPVCGSSTNPLAPKPLEGEKEDPNSESIYINNQTQQKSQQQQTLIVPVRLTAAQPLLIARPFIYTTHIQAW